jgi:hypothetical protein
MNNNNTEPTGTAVLTGILITIILTQTAIWTPLYILHKQNITTNHPTWPQTAIIAITWTLTRLWWNNLTNKKQ